MNHFRFGNNKRYQRRNDYAQGATGDLSWLRGGSRRRGASANDELLKMSQNPKDWVMPTGDYANTRYSKLNQINAQNVGKLRWLGPSRPACCAAMKVAR